MAAGADAERRALEQQPVGALQARVGEQLLEAEPRAPVGAQVARVDELLLVGLDEQRPRIRRRVVHGDARDREGAEAQGLVVRQHAQVVGQRRSGEEHPAQLEDVEEDAALEQLRCPELRRPERIVRALGVVERHTDVEQDVHAVVGGDLDAHAADLVAAAVDDMVRGGYSLVVDARCRSQASRPSGRSRKRVARRASADRHPHPNVHPRHPRAVALPLLPAAIMPFHLVESLSYELT